MLHVRLVAVTVAPEETFSALQPTFKPPCKSIAPAWSVPSTWIKLFGIEFVAVWVRVAASSFFPPSIKSFVPECVYNVPVHSASQSISSVPITPPVEDARLKSIAPNVSFLLPVSFVVQSVTTNCAAPDFCMFKAATVMSSSIVTV